MFKELYRKIKRHKENIPNSIRLGLSSARIETANNTGSALITGIVTFLTYRDAEELKIFAYSLLK